MNLLRSDRSWLDNFLQLCSVEASFTAEKTGAGEFGAHPSWNAAQEMAQKNPQQLERRISWIVSPLQLSKLTLS